MSQADHYRIKAAEFSARARSESAPHLQMEYATMAAGYLRLAEQADRNAGMDVVYEPPLQGNSKAF